MAVKGAEEDGVDNRVEAPEWTSDGGSDGMAVGDQAGEPADRAAESTSAPESAPSAGGPAASPDGKPKPQVNAGGSSPDAGASSRPNQAADGFGRGPSATPPLPAAAAQANLRPAPAPAQPSTLEQPSLMQAGQGSTSETARGLAAKVTAPFAALTRPRQRPAQTKRPAPGAGLPPRPSGVRPRATLSPAAPAGPQTRRAQLRLERIEPWSVMKFSFLLSLVGWVILFVAVAILYFSLSKLGVFHSIEHTVGLVTSNKTNPQGSNASSWFRASRVLGYTMLVGAVNVILITALATVGAVLYNLVTMLAGGVEVTLKESD